MYEFEKQKLYKFLGEKLVELFKKHKVYVAGGAITSLFCNREINDIDVYFKSQNQMTSFYEDIWESDYWITFHTKKSSTIKINDDLTIQLIHFDTFEKANNIFNKFDFTINMAAFDFGTGEFILHKDFLKHNSQRILKFNFNTEFPLISILRIHKYKERGYDISRSETIKIALTCANLNINSYEELFNQVTAMSEGENLEDIVDTSRPFDMIDILKQIENHNGQEKSSPKSLPFEDLDELLITITDKNYKPQYLKVGDNYLRLTNGMLKIADISDISKEYLINTDEYFKEYKFYKFVKKEDDRYFSHYDNKFEYKLGEVITPTNGDRGAIYCGVKEKLPRLTYRGNKNSVAIELEIENVNDIKEFYCLTGIELKRCKFIREVPKEEYDTSKDKVKDIDDEPW